MAGEIIQPLIDEFVREAATTRTVLAAMPSDKLEWTPHPKSMTLGALGRHIAMAPRHICGMLSTDRFDFSSMKSPPIGAETTEAILEAFDEVVADVQATLGGYDDAFATATWTGAMGDKVMLQAPRVAMVRMLVLNHIYHHRGQMTVYLRLLDVPVPSVYGPTADVNPFG